MGENDFVRRNGWNEPGVQQILVWILIVFTTACLFALEGPAFNTGWDFSIVGVACLFLGAHVTMIVVGTSYDPVDDNAKGNIYDKTREVPVFDRRTRRHVIEGDYCYICEAIVYKDSKHCRRCNKCVERFDHHCMWLNTCVGAKNYWIFIVTVITWMAANLVLACVAMFVFVNTFCQGNLLRDGVWWASQTVCVQVLLAFKATTHLSILAYQIWLMIFHARLAKLKQTTFEYMNRERDIDLEAQTPNTRPEPGIQTKMTCKAYCYGCCPWLPCADKNIGNRIAPAILEA